jgi:hypothetical protein
MNHRIDARIFERLVDSSKNLAFQKLDKHSPKSDERSRDRRSQGAKLGQDMIVSLSNASVLNLPPDRREKETPL